MAFADIFQKFFNKKVKEDTNFLALTITADRILASVWTFENEAVIVTGFAKKPFQNIESLVHQAAVAIDNAAQTAKSDFSQVVFGLSSNWFEEGQLTKDTSEHLKKLSEDLELDAQAFVPLSSSIKNFLKIKESSSPNAVLVGAFEDFFEVHLLRNNQVLSTKISKSKPTLEKISSLFRQLDSEKSLPSKIVVYGLAEDSDLVQEIQKASFKDIFVQQPKIEFIKDNELAKSVALSQATDILGSEPALTPQDASSSLPTATAAHPITHGSPSANELGFIEGEDVLKTDTSTLEEKEVEKPPPEIIESDVIESPQDRDNFAAEVEREMPIANKGAKQDELLATKSQSFIEQIITLSWFAKILDLFKARNAAKKIAIGLAIILAVSLLSLFIAGQTITSAQVVIKVNAQSKEDSFNVDVIKDGSSNFSKKQIAGNFVQGQASGNRKAVATGKKKVGEYAKGQVTVLNWTISKTDFPKGTVIISKDGVKFELASAIQVASRSASTPGQNNADVKAVDFGTGGNIGAGKDFTFKEYDELLYSATNASAFTGGDEKEVTVVSQDDLDKLQQSLFDSLKDNAVNDLKSKLSGQKYQHDAIQVAIDKKSFDKKVDEEASLVNLDLDVAASTIAYNESSLKELLAENIKSQAPENLESKPENIEILSINAKKGTNSLNLAGRFQAQFVPKFAEDDVKAKIAGKSVKTAREIIKQMPEVTDVTVDFSPSFTLASSIPRNKDKIKFKIEF